MTLHWYPPLLASMTHMIGIILHYAISLIPKNNDSCEKKVLKFAYIFGKLC